MSLPILRSFVEVYRCGSISEAARNLSLTQPAVSQHIAALEAQVGRPLFIRHVKGVQATIAAVDLAQQIGDGLDRAEAALSMMKARSANLSGTVHIAGPAEFMTERIAPHLAGLHQSGLKLRIHLGGKADLYDMLLSAQVDLAFTASTFADSRLAFQQVGTEHLMAVAAPNMAKDIPSAGELGRALQAHPVVAYDLEMPLIRDWCALNDVGLGDVQPAVTAPDLRIMRSLAASGAGWTVLPDYLCQKALQDGTLMQIAPKKPVPQNAIYLVWAKSALRHPRIAFAQQSLITSLTP